MLADVPAVPERIVELPVQVAPEHLLEGLANLGASSDRLREDRLSIGDVECQDDAGSTDRGWGEHPHLWELVGYVEEAVTDAQLDRHESAVRRRDPLDLLGAECVSVEGGSAVGALNDYVCGDRHAVKVRRIAVAVLNVLATPSMVIWRPSRFGCGASLERSGYCSWRGEPPGMPWRPRGEYVFGIVGEQPMRSRRGRERRLVRPGQLVAWDPSQPHAGSAVDDRPWSSRLVVIEVADLDALADDPESDPLADVEFPEPVLSDTDLAAGFLRLHAALESPSTRLERDERLAEWLRVLIDRTSAVRSPRPATTASDERALRLAFDYLADQPERNVGLDELATAAGIGKFRLIRLFRERTGLPPHALQIAHRIRAARRLLETGETIAQAARATGFADQSHLHRHFQRSLGLTPAKYQQRFNG